MGLRDMFLGLPDIGSVQCKWKEPTSLPLRLRGDIWIRIALALAIWAAVTGIFAAIFAYNVHRPGLGLALGLKPRKVGVHENISDSMAFVKEKGLA